MNKPTTSLKNKYTIAAGLIIAALVIFYSLITNNFKIAPDMLYDKYLDDSEALVVGRIVTDQRHQLIPSKAHLAHVSISDGANAFMQVFTLLDNPNLPDLQRPISTSGSYQGKNKGLHIILPYTQDLENYVGHQITVGSQTRTISFLERNTPSDPNITVFLSGKAPLPEQVTSVQISGAAVDASQIYINPYISQYGIQGSFYSALYNQLHLSLDTLHKLTAALLVLAITFLTFLYRRIFPPWFAVAFFISMILSPWIVVFGRNLYWCAFLWFTPAVFAAYFVLARTRIGKWLSLIGVYLAFTLKCLAGYEYISTIILFAAAPLAYQFIVHIKSREKWHYACGFLIICLLGVAGFTTALLMHAGIRGDTLIEGLRSIYELDVKRRTYADPSTFADMTGYRLQDSFTASVWDVLHIYLSGWFTDVIKFLASWSFLPLFIGSLLVCTGAFFLKSKNKWVYAGLFIAFVPATFSWLVLAKAHSYVHPHLNFVLWYFGGVATMIYICCAGLNFIFNTLAPATPPSKENTKHAIP